MGLNLLASGHGFPIGRDNLQVLSLALNESSDQEALPPFILHLLPVQACEGRMD